MYIQKSMHQKRIFIEATRTRTDGAAMVTWQAPVAMDGRDAADFRWTATAFWQRSLGAKRVEGLGFRVFRVFRVFTS